MKALLLSIAFALLPATTVAAIAVTDAGQRPSADLAPLPHHQQAAQLSARILTRYHYSAQPLDDALSEKIFATYLKALDGEKLFFLQADIDEWKTARTELDDAINGAELDIPFAIYNRYLQRASERFTQARRLLASGFDFTLQESRVFSREKAPWAQSEQELQDIWRKRVKDDWLRLRLAGKADSTIVETLDRRYENSLKRLAKIKADDAFQTFMNAYTMAIEPHTSYLGARAAEDFGITMKLSLVGIGAVLYEKDDYTTIRELMAGGPATLSKQLKVGDRIVAVGQGDNGPLTDVVGWRIDDVVSLIRGTADTVVRLDILPADAGPAGKHKIVPLVRKKIALEEQAAKKTILSAKDTGASGSIVTSGMTRRIGVITLPTFYQDFEARNQGKKDFKSATRDVARILGELKAEKVDSVLIDLRNNGGGSLTEAIELTGLFIDKGPVVQQRDARGTVTVMNDEDPGTAWDGPLGVLINRYSASASEIFAAAIQDYGRGLIIGERSFGKGTVQSLINLDRRSYGGGQKLGDLKLTVAQFFRIDGGTTQLRGVQPDIAFPVLEGSEEIGEAAFPNPLPWTQIAPAGYTPLADRKAVQPALAALHRERMVKDADLRDLTTDFAEFNALRKANTISLNEVERRRERDAVEARQKAREAREARAAASEAAGTGGSEKTAASGSPRKKAAPIRPSRTDDGLYTGEKSLEEELAEESARRKERDAILLEATNILANDAGLQRSGVRFAVTGKPAGTSPLADKPTALR